MDKDGWRPIVIKSRYEPDPIWHKHVGTWLFILYFRPSDICVGFQPMFGGGALHIWPLMLCAVRPAKVLAEAPAHER